MSAVQQEWMFAARCKGVPANIMFPVRGESVEAAIRVCSECPVIEECLEYALVNREVHGVWGGTSERTRRRMRRARNKAIPSAVRLSLRRN